jgi:arsenate reductase
MWARQMSVRNARSYVRSSHVYQGTCMITIYHNPSCSKSRGTLAMIEEAGAPHEVVEYLKSPLTRDDLVTLLGKLAIDPGELVRKDKRFKELGLDAADYTTRDAVAEVLSEHPALMQRPVVVKGGRAVIGRPPENVQKLL